MKYKNYKELFKAYKSGELSRENSILLDNDHCAVYVDDEKVFEGGGCCDTHNILEDMGFPVEGV